MKRCNLVLAIDPGVNGAFVLTDGKKLKTWPMPITTTGKEKLISFGGVLKLLTEIQTAHGSVFVYLERAIPMAQGAKSAFTYGRGFEAIVNAVELLKFPFILVEPHKWAKEMHEGISADLKPKAKSLVAVKRLFPTLVAALPKKPKGGLHDGPVDALLIAGYALRKRGAASSTVEDFF